MTVTVMWDNELEDVIRYQFIGRWTWQEFLLGFEQEVRMVQSLHGRRYDVIGDTMESAVLPGGSGLTHIYSVYRRYPQNWGITMIVTQSSFVRAMYKVGERLHPDTKNAFIIVPTLEEARTTIRGRRAELVTHYNR